MFCFNIRNKKYAIGNVEVGREKYMQIKKILLAQLNEELSKKNEVSLSIYNLPDKVKSKQ